MSDRRRESSAQDVWYRELVESAPDATVLIDSDGVILLVNRQVELLFGYPRDELVGQPLEILVPDRNHAAHRIHRERYFGTPTVRPMGANLDLTGRKKDGTEIPVEISLSSVRTESGLYAAASIRDGTLRKKIQSQLKNLLETAPDAMLIVDREGTIVIVNEQAVRLFGYARESLIGAPVEMLLPERLRGAHHTHRDAFFATPNVRPMGAGLELSCRRKDGSEVPIEISLSPFETDEGTLVTAAIRDVTEAREAKRKLAAYAARLESTNRELEQFSYFASHDLQAPVRTILSFAEILRESLGERLDATTREYFDFIEDGARHMQTLILDLLELSRASRTERKLEIVSVEDVITKACRQLGPQLTESDAEVHYADLPDVRADATKLQQVFQNLVSNATKFHEPDARPHVVITAQREDANWWRFAVEDDGIGIPPKRLPEVFSAFRRFHDSRRFPGTGIGLAICKKIIEMHGGRIWVESNPGDGTTFFFTLPHVDATPAVLDPG